jgi:hypothetical protein
MDDKFGSLNEVVMTTKAAVDHLGNSAGEERGSLREEIKKVRRPITSQRNDGLLLGSDSCLYCIHQLLPLHLYNGEI